MPYKTIDLLNNNSFLDLEIRNRSLIGFECIDHEVIHPFVLAFVESIEAGHFYDNKSLRIVYNKDPFNFQPEKFTIQTAGRPIGLLRRTRDQELRIGDLSFCFGAHQKGFYPVTSAYSGILAIGEALEGNRLLKSYSTILYSGELIHKMLFNNEKPSKSFLSLLHFWNGSNAKKVK